MKTSESSRSEPLTSAAPYVLRPGTAEVRWMGETSTQFLATGETTGGEFTLVDEVAHQGESVPLHLHRADVESFYVLDGEMSFYLGEHPPVLATRGTFVHIPAGTVHGFRIESDTARYLILTTPGHGEFYRAISFPSRPGGEAPETPVTPEQIAAACKKYGVEFVGPLPANEPDPNGKE